MKTSVHTLLVLIVVTLCSCSNSSAFQAQQPIIQNNPFRNTAADSITMGRGRKRRRSANKPATALQKALPSPSNNSHDNGSTKKQKKDYTSTQLSAASLSIQQRPFQIFCDLDGVLCDFDAGVRCLSQGVAADNLPVKRMWRLIDKADRFYERLPWTRDGRKLWETIRPHQPNILTGISMGSSCPSEKASWCSRELGVEVNHVCKAGERSAHKVVTGNPKAGVVNIITCWSRNKHYESGHKAVLIDDRIALAADWVSKGGIFIHHTNTERTLKQLREHGIIDEEDNKFAAVV